MAKISLPKGSGKRLKVREKSVKSQGILKWKLSGNPAPVCNTFLDQKNTIAWQYTIDAFRLPSGTFKTFRNL